MGLIESVSTQISDSLNKVRSSSVLTSTPQVKKASLQTNVDSIASCDKKEVYEPSTPRLMHPNSNHHIFRLAAFVDELKATSDSWIQEDVARSKQNALELATAENANAKKIEEAATRAQQSKTWGTLRDVASALMSATAIILGGSFLMSGVGSLMFAGGCLVASGITAVTGLTLANAGYDPKVTGALAFLSAGLGLAGGLLGSVQVAQQVPKLIFSVINGALSVTVGVSIVGKGVADGRKSWLEAARCEMQNLLALFGIKSEEIQDDIEQIEQNLESVRKAAQENIKNYSDAMHRIVHMI